MSPILLADWSDIGETIAKQSPTLVTLMAMVALLFRYMSKQHRENLKTKDDEIKRLSDEKRELQKMVFKGRLLSTEETPGEKEAKDAQEKKTAPKPATPKPESKSRRNSGGGKK